MPQTRIINTNKAYYLTSIDGLRALAVMMVLLFHVDVEWMKGGFIGVDIFFVISGFLITANITREMDRKQWRFSTFYIKRIARLFPALFTVIIITIAASYYVLSPEDLNRVAQSALYTTFSLSNFFFYSESGYFDSSAITKPLLHTWSLSVEEQFYLVWPLTIFVLMSIGSRRMLRKGVVVISIISIVAVVVLNPTNSDMIFFITPFRAYQFGIGALIALSGIAITTSDQKIKTRIGWFSVLCIVVLSVSITGNKNILLTAILPALAAGGFIIAAETGGFKSIFASPLFVWVGQRSYSIYLAHWPIIVLWQIEYGPNFDAKDKAQAIFLSVFAGFLLHYIVEKRFRLNSNTINAYKFRSFAFVSTLIISIIGVSTFYIKADGYPDRFPQDLISTASNLGPHWNIRQKNLRTGVCNILIGTLGDQDVFNFDLDECIKSPSPESSYLVIGDSYASGAYLFFKNAYPETYFGQLTIPGCYLRPVKKIKNEVCADLYEAALTNSEFMKNYKGVIIASNWQSQHMGDLDELVETLAFLNKDIVMVGQRLRFDSKLPSIVLSTFSREDAVKKANSLLMQTQNNLNRIMKSKYSSGVKYVDLMELQCRDYCDIFTADGDIMYLDDSHLSMGGALLIAQRLQGAYPDLLK